MIRRKKGRIFQIELPSSETKKISKDILMEKIFFYFSLSPLISSVHDTHESTIEIAAI